jgi:chromosomal replication initiation ATPase DnaA
MAALADALGAPDARAWLKDVALEKVDDAWVLLAATRFVAHWIATHFEVALARAAKAAELAETPQVRARAARG